MWQQIKNLFSKSQESAKVLSEETIQPISKDDSNEPVIKKLKRQVRYKKEPNYR